MVRKITRKQQAAAEVAARLVAEEDAAAAAARRPAGFALPAKDGKWAKGTSGNAAGRPKGSRNKLTRVCAELLADGAAEIMGRVIRLAKKGDAVALKLCVERLLPARASRDRWVSMELPQVETAEDISHAAAAVVEQVGSGRITLSEGREFMGLLDAQRRALETAELAARIGILEVGGAHGGDDGVDLVRVRQVSQLRRDLDVHLAGRVEV